MMRTIRKDQMDVKIYQNRDLMGFNCAVDIVNEINRVINEKGECRIIFAAAPSQNDVLGYLIKSEVDFSKIVAFHMDEYHLLPLDSDKRFKYFLNEKIFKHRNFKEVNYLVDRDDLSVEEQIKNYEQRLTEKDIDICLLGVGENGHLAFNEPAYANFNDKKIIKEIELDEVCRYQQLHDAGYNSIDEVPRTALTLTVPVLTGCKKLFCIAPTDRKRKAIHESLNGEVTEKCPASILRTLGTCTMYIDEEAYGE